MTMTASDKYTYQRTVLCLARVLAGIQPTPWEKVHSTCDIPDIRGKLPWKSTFHFPH